MDNLDKILVSDQRLRLGKLFEKYRVDQGFSQSEFAIKLNLSQSQLSAIENGRQLPTLQTLITIVNVLGNSKSTFAIEMLIKIMLSNDDISLNDSDIQKIAKDFRESLAETFRKKIDSFNKQYNYLMHSDNQEISAELQNNKFAFSED